MGLGGLGLGLGLDNIDPMYKIRTQTSMGLGFRLDNNSGFDFRVTSIPGTGNSYVNGTCHHVVNSKDLSGNEGSFISLEHW